MLYRKYRRKYMRALKSTSLLTLIALFFVTNFVFIFMPHRRVYAQAADNISPQDQIKHIQAARFIGACLNKGSDGVFAKSELSLSELDNYDIFWAKGFAGQEFDVGFVADPSDGRWRCTSDLSQLKNAMGMTSKELFIDSGVYKPKLDKTGYELAEGNMGAAADKIYGAAAKKYPGINFNPNMSKGLQYFSLLATFKAQCNGGEDPIGGTPVKELDEKGNIIQPSKMYSLKDANKDWPVGFNIDSPAHNDMNCRDIVSRLNSDDYINEASKILKDYIAKGGSPETPAGTAAPSCESNNGKIIIGWLVCGVIGILDDAVDQSTEVINNLLYFNVSSIDPDDSTSTNGCTAGSCLQAKKNLKSAWSVFRVLSSVTLLAVALIMIIGQAVAGE